MAALCPGQPVRLGRAWLQSRRDLSARWHIGRVGGAGRAYSSPLKMLHVPSRHFIYWSASARSINWAHPGPGADQGQDAGLVICATRRGLVQKLLVMLIGPVITLVVGEA